MKKYVLASKKPKPKVMISPALTFDIQYAELINPNISPFLSIAPYFSHTRCTYLPWLTQRKPAENPVIVEPIHVIVNFKAVTEVKEANMPDI